MPTSKRLRLHCSALNAASLGRAGLALLAGFSFASASAARAADAAPTEQGTGFYATLGLGASESEATSASKISNTTLYNGLYEFKRSMLLEPSTGFAAEAGLGYDFGSIRTELSYLYNNFSLNNSIRNAEINKIAPNRIINLSANPITGQPVQSRTKFNASADANSLMTSAYLDIPTGSRFVPYIGGGIGITRIAVNDFPRKHENLQMLGYQAKLGVSYLASCSTDLFAEGTYKGSTGMNNNDIDSSGLNSWGARLGARLRFANRCASSSLAK